MQRPARGAIGASPTIAPAIADSKSSVQSHWLHVLMVLSGFAGLGYEMVWTKMLAVALGHEIVAVLAVIAAFFTGLAIGAFALDKQIRASAVPGRWYVVLEIIIGAWALALIPIIPWFNDLMPGVIGEQPSAVRQWASVFCGTLLLLLPATVAMGATLPAMERLVSALRQDGWSVSGLYAANTFGAVLGTMLTTFLIAPMLGFTVTLALLAAVNFGCALAVALGAARGESGRRPVVLQPASPPGRQRLQITLFSTGLIGIGYQVLVVRVLSQVLENTVYTFASLLSVYLLGTALGAFLYQRLAPRDRFTPVLAALLTMLAMASLIGVALLWASGPLQRSIPHLLGSGYTTTLAGEFVIALAVFLLPTVLMGATFSHLAQAARDTLGIGRALGTNTLGAALSPLVFGVVLLPLIGAKTLLILISAAYLLLIPIRAGSRWLALPAGLAAVLLILPVPLRFIDVPPGSEIVSYDEGIMASVSVIRDPNNVHFLKVNNHYTMGSSASAYSDRRQTHIPLLLHPQPRDVLYLGLGTGSTFAAAAEHPGLSATAVELIPEILPTIGAFGPSLEAYRGNERFRLLVSDARRYMGATSDDYDVVIAEVFHPSRDGAGSLYTVEHFAAIRARLREDGLFCQWLPLFQLDLDTLRTIVRSFVEVYPDAEAYLAHYSLGQPLIALVGRAGEPANYRRGWIAERVRDRRLAEDLTRVRLTTDFALFGGLLGSGDALVRFAGDGPLNTDDHPVVTFEAPRFVYTEQDAAWVRLLEIVEALDADPAGILDTSDPQFERFASRLDDYWRARNAYLRAGVDVRPVNDIGLMLEQIAEPLLAVVRLSNDFTPAYLPLLEMARELHASDPAAARQLLLALEQAGPARPEAAWVKSELFGE